MKSVYVMTALIVLGIGIGCASLSDYITPARIDSKAVEFAEQAGVVEPNAFSGYANLEKALRLQIAVDNAYEVKSLAIEQLAEKNQLDYNVLKGVVAGNLKLAKQRAAQLFGETGLLSMGLTALGFGGLTGLLGLMRKRPGDITPIEMESAVQDIKGEVTSKDRQMIEIIAGVQKFLNKHTVGDTAGDELRSALSAQSFDTRQAVALAKATLL